MSKFKLGDRARVTKYTSCYNKGYEFTIIEITKNLDLDDLYVA